MKAQQLLDDLRSKYPHYAVPSQISLMELRRLLAVHAVPAGYVDVLSLTADIHSEYNPEYDVRSSKFNAARALSDNKIIASKLDLPPLDNMSKAWRILPGSEQRAPEAPIVSAKRQLPATEHSPAKREPVQTRIALDSIRSGRRSGAHDSASLTDSPLSLLLQLMQSRDKATVVIRRRNR